MIRNQASLWQWILAAILSIFLWVISIDENHFEIKYTLPLATPSISSDFMVLDKISHDSVEVTFAGQGISVLRDQVISRPESIHVNIAISDQSQVFPQRIIKEFTKDNILFNGDRYSNLEATVFNPGTIELVVDRVAFRNLPVGIESSGSIPARYYWREVSRSEVEVSGAESVVSHLDSCYTSLVEPDAETTLAAIVKPEGVVYISPDSVYADLVPPVQVVTRIE